MFMMLSLLTYLLSVYISSSSFFLSLTCILTKWCWSRSELWNHQEWLAPWKKSRKGHSNIPILSSYITVIVIVIDSYYSNAFFSFFLNFVLCCVTIFLLFSFSWLLFFQSTGHVKEESEIEDATLLMTRDQLSSPPPPSDEEGEEGGGCVDWPPKNFNSLHPVALPFGPRTLDQRVELSEQVGEWAGTGDFIWVVMLVVVASS